MPRAVAAAHTTPAAILNGRWTHNRKAWMTTEVFCEWLLDLKADFGQLPVPYLHLSMSCDLCVQTFGTDHIVLLFIRQV